MAEGGRRASWPAVSPRLRCLIFVRVCGWLVLPSRSSASKNAGPPGGRVASPLEPRREDQPGTEGGVAARGGRRIGLTAMELAGLALVADGSC